MTRRAFVAFAVLLFLSLPANAANPPRTYFPYRVASQTASPPPSWSVTRRVEGTPLFPQPRPSFHQGKWGVYDPSPTPVMFIYHSPARRAMRRMGRAVVRRAEHLAHNPVESAELLLDWAEASESVMHKAMQQEIALRPASPSRYSHMWYRTGALAAEAGNQAYDSLDKARYYLNLVKASARGPGVQPKDLDAAMKRIEGRMSELSAANVDRQRPIKGYAGPWFSVHQRNLEKFGEPASKPRYEIGP